MQIQIHDQMAVAVAVDCALRLRTFAQKFLTRGQNQSSQRIYVPLSFIMKRRIISLLVLKDFLAEMRPLSVEQPLVSTVVLSTLLSPSLRLESQKD